MLLRYNLPHQITWHPMLRSWTYLVDTNKTITSNWVEYPNPCSINIYPQAKIDTKNQLTIKFDIDWQPPEEKTTKDSKEYETQHLPPFQDNFYFQCEANIPGAELLSFSPLAPNKRVQFSEKSSLSISPALELAIGPEHVSGQIGLGHYTHAHTTSESFDAVEVIKNQATKNKFDVSENLTYCKESKTASAEYDVSDPGKSLQRTKGLIFGWDYLLSPPNIARSLYRTQITATFQLPVDYKNLQDQCKELEFNLTLKHGTTSYEIWKRVRGQGFTSHGIFKRKLKVAINDNECNTRIVASKSPNLNDAERDTITANHFLHRSRFQTNLPCCFYSKKIADGSEIISRPINEAKI